MMMMKKEDFSSDKDQPFFVLHLNEEKRKNRRETET